MPITTPNAQIPLAVQTAQPFTAFQNSQRQVKQNQLLQTQTEAIGQRTAQAQSQAEVDEAERLKQQDTIERFRNIESGVKQLSPLLDQVIAGKADPNQFITALGQRREQLIQEGRDTQDTDLAIQTAQGGNLGGVRQLFDQVLENGRRLDAQGLGLDDPQTNSRSNVRSDFFNELSADLSTDDQEQARRIQLGLEPRAVGSANITIAEDDDLTESVADSQATIAGRKKFSELNASTRSKFIEKGFDTIQSIDKNVRNLNKAIVAIDEGASTGVIESRFFPSFRESTLKLEQVQKELGLDVVGGVTFGALSKGELDLALAVALNTGLEPDALRQFLVEKITAQTKLRSYFAEQVDFLDRNEGNTIAKFLRKKEREAGRGDQSGNASQSAIDFLKANDTPENRQQFIDKFGALPEGF